MNKTIVMTMLVTLVTIAGITAVSLGLTANYFASPETASAPCPSDFFKPGVDCSKIEPVELGSVPQLPGSDTLKRHIPILGAIEDLINTPLKVIATAWAFTQIDFPGLNPTFTSIVIGGLITFMTIWFITLVRGNS